MGRYAQFRRAGQDRQQSRRLSLVFFLAVSFFMTASSLYGAQASVFEKARETVIDFAEPVLRLLNWPIRQVENTVGNISDYLNVLEQNEALRRENAELREWVNEAVTLRRRVAYFEDLLGIKDTEQMAVIDGRVTGEAGGPYQRSVLLNVGASDGVERGDAVIDSHGLLGHIVTTGRGASRVLLLTDFSSRTPVFIEGADVEAILAGEYTDLPRIVFLASRDQSDLAVGQRVVTSGAEGELPRGLPVGEVAEISEDGVRIRLFSDYLSTDYVRVLDYTFTDDQPEADAVDGNGEDT